MLVIRTEQVQALAASILPEYRDRLLRRLQFTRPAEFARIGDAGMQALVEQGIAAALGCGIETERDVAGFIDLRLKIGPGFDAALEGEAARHILSDETLPGTFKLQMLYSQLTGELMEH